MRENMGVYRGQTKDGEWVEGYFAKTILSNGELIYEIRDIEEEHRLAWYTEVLPETVGQWTGLMDKNGKRIFEGDIVNCSQGCPHKVIFLNEYAGQYCGGMPAFYLSGLGVGYAWTGDEEHIGNCVDNPELVKE